MSISRKDRAEIRAYLETHHTYDADSLHISRGGLVTVCADPNKAPALTRERYFLGDADYLLDTIRQNKNTRMRFTVNWE